MVVCESQNHFLTKGNVMYIASVTSISIQGSIKERPFSIVFSLVNPFNEIKHEVLHTLQ